MRVLLVVIFVTAFFALGGGTGGQSAVRAAPTGAQSSATARQVVLQPKDVPGGGELPADTHATPPFGACISGYQSGFSSGLGGSEAIVSEAYRCPSASVAVQMFPRLLSSWQQTYDRQKWHYRALSGVKAGHEHFAWYVYGLPGVRNLSGHAVKVATVFLTFQRDNFLALVEISYSGETLRQAEHHVHKLAHVMNRRIVLGSRMNRS